MMQLLRLNGDSTWHLTWDDTSLLLDPWLVGSQSDGPRWFSEQSHVIEPVRPSAVSRYDAIVLTQRYTDHAHHQTLVELATYHGVVPTIAVAGANRVARKAMPTLPATSVTTIAASDKEWTRVKSLRLKVIEPSRRMPPVYKTLLVMDDNDEVLMFSPHGIALRPSDEELLRAHTVRVLLTSFSKYQLPPWLGGTVAAGPQVAKQLISIVQPRAALATHDEPKLGSGVVARLAKTMYPTKEELSREFDSLVHCEVGQTITL